MTDVRSFQPGDPVDYHHDPLTVLPATVLRRWDDDYLIRVDPRVAPEVAARVLVR
jgi:hypothetical protein